MSAIDVARCLTRALHGWMAGAHVVPYDGGIVPPGTVVLHSEFLGSFDSDTSVLCRWMASSDWRRSLDLCALSSPNGCPSRIISRRRRIGWSGHVLPLAVTGPFRCFGPWRGPASSDVISAAYFLAASRGLPQGVANFYGPGYLARLLFWLSPLPVRHVAFCALDG